MCVCVGGGGLEVNNTSKSNRLRMLWVYGGNAVFPVCRCYSKFYASNFPPNNESHPRVRTNSLKLAQPNSSQHSQYHRGNTATPCHDPYDSKGRQYKHETGTRTYSHASCGCAVYIMTHRFGREEE